MYASPSRMSPICTRSSQRAKIAQWAPVDACQVERNDESRLD